MARPMKWRKVCSLPEHSSFGPLTGEKITQDSITMTVDEYETIRLIDLERFTQKECADKMNVARTTVQGIYNEARIKIAEALVFGKVLLIDGGEYRLCDEIDNNCGPGCYRQGRGRGRRYRGGRGRD